MKLYYTPGACSQAPHIVLQELDLKYQPIKVDLPAHTLPDGSDFRAINPKGYVPMLELDDGTRLREGPAILQYIADLAPIKNLAPAAGTLQRYRLQEWLTFIGTEVHKGFSPLFNPGMPEEAKGIFKDKLKSRFQWLDGELASKQFLMGDHFSVADGYLFTVTNWAKPTGVDISAFANVQAWHARVAARPAVQEAMKAEGLLK